MGNGRKEDEGEAPRAVDDSQGAAIELARENVTYADVVEVRGTLYGFQLLLGYRMPPREQNGMEQIFFESMVRMSPQHTKDLSLILLEKVIDYERKFGHIPSTFDVQSIVFATKPQFMPPASQPEKGEVTRPRARARAR